MSRYFVGIDLGSSFVKTSLFDAELGVEIAHAQFPEAEMPIMAPAPGYAEQDPENWWLNVQKGFLSVMAESTIKRQDIAGFGISAQMHGLVVLKKNGKPARPAIIWCDGRAVGQGSAALEGLGSAWCHDHLLNSPGNFTASRLSWVQKFEPRVYSDIDKVMLPADYIAFRLTGEYSTTACSLSEAMFWDFRERSLSANVLSWCQFDSSLFPPCVPALGHPFPVSSQLAQDWGLNSKTSVSYRAGDQPNNAFSLRANHPGVTAVTAGTSAVSYAITDERVSDVKGRVNTFVHPTDTRNEPRNGVLACINGGGSWHSWLRSALGGPAISYQEMDRWAMMAPLGSDGLTIYSFGNGPERLLGNRNKGAQIVGLRFSEHGREHIIRAGMEGIAYALRYGMDVMQEMGISNNEVRAGFNNMFLSTVFQDIFVNATQTRLTIYDTSGAEGAARGAALGNGFYSSEAEALAKLNVVRSVEPDPTQADQYSEVYARWKKGLSSV